jgi:hypothetical protein
LSGYFALFLLSMSPVVNAGVVFRE